MLLPTRSAIIVAFTKVRPSLELDEKPISAPPPQLFVVLATLTRSHITRGAKLKTELLSEAASPSIGARNSGRNMIVAVEALPASRLRVSPVRS